jgi:hypothetical protein
VLFACVPETPVNEDSDSGPYEDDVRTTRKASHVEPISQASSVESPTESSLGFGITCSLLSHEALDVD